MRYAYRQKHTYIPMPEDNEESMAVAPAIVSVGAKTLGYVWQKVKVKKVAAKKVK